MINIGFEAKRAFANKTGLGNYSRQLILSLLEFCPEFQLYLFSPKTSIDNWGYEKFPQANLVSHSSPLSALWRAWGQTREPVFSKLDIYHGLSHELPYGGDRKTKWVVTMHDLIFLHFPELYRAPDRLIYQIKFKHACEKADKIVAISQQTANDLSTFWNVDPAKIEIVYQSCHPSYWTPVSLDELERVKKKYQLPEKFFFSVGTLEPRKNVLNILKALLATKSDVPLYIVGDGGDYKKILQDYVAQNNLSKRVHFLGRAPFEDLPVLYRLATALIYPSFFEGFGIPLIEALFSGTPVISSKGPCICFEEAAGPGGIYIDPHSPEELAQAMDQLIFDEDKCKKLAELGGEYVNKFRPEKLALQWAGLYRKIISG